MSRRPRGGLTMHRRLRRQLDEALVQEDESSPHLRKLFRKIEKDYRRADGDRASLQRALALLSDLLQRKPDAERRRAPSVKARSISRLFEQAPFAALLCDGDRKVSAWNAAAERMFGIPASEAIGRELSMLVFPDTDANRAQARTELRQSLASAETQQFQRETPSRDGEPRTCEWTLVPLHDAKGRELGKAAVVQERGAVDDRYALAWQGSGDGIWDWELGSDRLWLSDSWRALVGDKGTGETPAAWLDRIHPADREGVEAAVRTHVEGRSPRFESEHRLRHDDGSWRWVLSRGQATRDPSGKAVRFSGSTMDVTGPRATVALISDALTRLPNRSHFLDLLTRSLARARRGEGDRLAVLFLDLDRFQSVNERFGPRRGRRAAGADGTAARDLPARGRHARAARRGRVHHPARRAARDLRRRGGGPTDPRGRPGTVRARRRQGLLHGEHRQSRSARRSTRAEKICCPTRTRRCTRAKAQGRARSAIFDAALRDRSPHLLELETDLRHALERDEFRVHYLPIVDVTTGRIQGVEALIRWAHPTRGLVSPEHFVPFAEEMGLMVPIGRWLLDHASREFQSWRGVGGERLSLNVNLSSRQLEHGELLENIDGLLGERRLEAQDLVLELTENTLQNGEHAERMAQLRGRGVRLSMDDFGTGCCSLNSLLRSQFDCLKIDRSLFSGGSPQGQAPELVRTILSLAKDLGTQVVAEGVETAEQLGFSARDRLRGGARVLLLSPFAYSPT